MSWLGEVKYDEDKNISIRFGNMKVTDDISKMGEVAIPSQSGLKNE